MNSHNKSDLILRLYKGNRYGKSQDSDSKHKQKNTSSIGKNHLLISKEHLLISKEHLLNVNKC